jgi:hypothetical protein
MENTPQQIKPVTLKVRNIILGTSSTTSGETGKKAAKEAHHGAVDK